MGQIRYDGMVFQFDDRVLAHLQVVIGQKLRRREPFFLRWTPQPGEVRGGRHVIWIDNGIPLHIDYTDEAEPAVNRRWIEALAESSMSNAGLLLSAEPA